RHRDLFAIDLEAAVASITTTTAGSSAAAGAGFAGLGFIDGQRPAVLLLAVQSGNRRGGLGVTAHLHESETLASAGFAILNDLSALDRAVRREHLLQCRIVDLVTHIADI